MTFYDNASGEMLVEQISYSVFHHWLLVLLCYKLGTCWGKTELLRTFPC